MATDNSLSFSFNVWQLGQDSLVVSTTAFESNSTNDQEYTATWRAEPW
jgi:hypothetical protein